MTLRYSDLYREVKEQLQQSEAEISSLLAVLLSTPRLDRHLDGERPIDDESIALVRSAVMRLLNGEPWQQVVGSVDFLGCRITLSPAVLIPRQETEVLIAQLIPTLPRSCRLLDLCTGSGCIALAIKKQRPDIDVVAADISSEALEIARENAQINQLEVDFRQGDLFAPVEGERFDCIVCNPPYISIEDYQNLEDSVRLYEPALALVGGEDGLAIYRRLHEQLRHFLHPNGRVWLEIGSEQKEPLFELFEEDNWPSRSIIQDWAGLDRFFLLE